MAIHIKDSDDLKTRLSEAGEKLVVINFMANWGEPCKAIGPKIEELALEMADSIVVFKVVVDECEDIATEYDIDFIPTFVFMKSSKKIEGIVGVILCVDKLKNTIFELKFAADKVFAGTSSGHTHSSPDNIEMDVPMDEPTCNPQPEADFNPFGLDRSLSEASRRNKRAAKSSQKRDHHEPYAKKRRD